MAITVTPVNDLFVALSQSLTTGLNTPVTVKLGATDVDDSVFTYKIKEKPKNGGINTSGINSGLIIYSPNQGFKGSDTIKYTVVDAQGRESPEAIICISVAAGNQRPTANPQNITINEDETCNITLTGSDVETPVQNLLFLIVDPPRHGQLKGAPPLIRYKPSANYYGADTFSFTVNDGSLTSDPARVVITILSVNDLPRAVFTANPVTGVAPLTVSFNAGASTDIEGTITSYSWSFGDGAAGSGAQTTHTFTAGGTYIVSLIVTDDSGGTDDTTATITVTEIPTIAEEASASFTSDTTALLSVVGADDGGEQYLTYTWAATGTPPAAVTFGVNGTNASKNTVATFTKAGSYDFEVTVRDAGGLSVTSAVTVIVEQTLTSIIVSPSNAQVNISSTQQFTASGYDRFGDVLTVQPSFNWSVSGGGKIDEVSGLFTAGDTTGDPFTVTASSEGVEGTAEVTVTDFSLPPEE